MFSQVLLPRFVKAGVGGSSFPPALIFFFVIPSLLQRHENVLEITVPNRTAIQRLRNLFYLDCKIRVKEGPVRLVKAPPAVRYLAVWRIRLSRPKRRRRPCEDDRGSSDKLGMGENSFWRRSLDPKA